MKKTDVNSKINSGGHSYQSKMHTFLWTHFWDREFAFLGAAISLLCGRRSKCRREKVRLLAWNPAFDHQKLALHAEEVFRNNW